VQGSIERGRTQISELENQVAQLDEARVRARQAVEKRAEDAEALRARIREAEATVVEGGARQDEVDRRRASAERSLHDEVARQMDEAGRESA
jgi:chromosome segregation ATPase